MPIRLSEIIADEKKVTVTLGQHSIVIGYRPNAITMPMLVSIERMQAGRDTEEAMTAMAELLCTFIGSWDITDESDTPIPVTVEAVQRLPWRLILLLMQAVKEDIQAEAQEKKVLNGNLGAGLPTTDKSASARSGMASSGPQNSFQ
jgi:hypothetical protein